MPECDGCRFCCRVFEVENITLPVLHTKPVLANCVHECDAGCAVHGTDAKPLSCQTFTCPYIEGAPTHRPDTFQSLLKDSGLYCYIPWIPTAVPVDEVKHLIVSTQSILCAIRNGEWVVMALALHPELGQPFTGTQAMQDDWHNLLARYGCHV